MPGSRKLGRSSDHRKARMRAMVTFLFETVKIGPRRGDAAEMCIIELI